MLAEINNASSKLKEFLRWDDSVYDEYGKMLDRLKYTNGKAKEICTNDEKKRALEDIVTFLFVKTNLFEVYDNVQTGTSEVDQLVVRNTSAKIAESMYGLTPKVLEIDSDMLICECKNYKTSIAGTWVGKFNTIMDVCGEFRIGILFSVNGLSGSEETWKDGHGMRKIIYALSELNPGREKYILDFNINDFNSILETRNDKQPLNIIEIIRKKKIALKSGTKIGYLYDSNDNVEAVKKIVENYKNQIGE